MKIRLLLVIYFLIAMNSVFAQPAFDWKDITYRDALKTASKENKYVMVYLYFTGCWACADMENKTFTNPSVIDYYSKNFISIKINVQTKYGIKYKEQFKPTVYPTIIFLSQTGAELHRLNGSYSKDEFILQAKKALSKTESLSFLRNEYNSGNRNPSFLFKYIYAAKNNRELDEKVIFQYLDSQSDSDLFKTENIKLLYDLSIYNYKPVFLFNSRYFKFMDDNRELFYQSFDKAQVDYRLLRIAYIFSNSDNIIDTLFWQALEIVARYNYQEIWEYKNEQGYTIEYTFGKDRVSLAKMHYFDLINDTINYNKALNDHIINIINDWSEFNLLAKRYCFEYNDTYHLNQALEWIEKSVAIYQCYANTDNYANILFKLGNLNEALKQAKIAVELAKNEKQSPYPTEQLILKINAEILKKIKG